MPSGVVDIFEMIQVHKEHRKRPAMAGCQRDRAIKPILQEQSVGQAGQTIVLRQARYSERSGARFFTQSTKHDHRTCGAAFPIANRGY